MPVPGCLLTHLLTGKANKILPYMLYYLVFYGIGWAGVRLLDSNVAFSVSSMLSSIGIVGRKILIPCPLPPPLPEKLPAL